MEYCTHATDMPSLSTITPVSGVTNVAIPVCVCVCIDADLSTQVMAVVRKLSGSEALNTTILRTARQKYDKVTSIHMCIM